MNLHSIMVVDDCDLSQMIAQLAIEAFDDSISFSQAFDGQEALELLGGMHSPPDLIFLDINMPRMDGHQFLAHYDKSFEQKSEIAMLSSSNLEADIEATQCYDFVKHYFDKPFCEEILQTAATTFRAC